MKKSVKKSRGHKVTQAVIADVLTSEDFDMIVGFIAQKRSEHEGKIEINGFHAVITNFTILVQSTYYKDEPVS